ncbi:MAG: GH3 auxin-responsive promoter family protein [Bacteroidia bacterium]|nr:GH3 auxin-responsive promoter family protein [Bacteroidia bacterium]
MPAILGNILKNTIAFTSKIKRRQHPYIQQKNVLKKLLNKARNTAFGQYYNFDRILNSTDVLREFQKTVPTHDYNKIYREWWYRTLNGEPYVCWPGYTKYFALSSGTSEASSKYIPVTKDMLKSIQKGAIRQILSTAHFNLPAEIYQKGILMIGGSTHLNFNGTYFAGDLSGITTGNIPFWFQHYYKPGRKISGYKDWNQKLKEMTLNAHKWDIGIVCGVPAWIQLLFEMIIEHYKLKSIHDIWPNLKIYVHGGVAIHPYKASLKKLFSKEVIFVDTYMASEGFIAFEEVPNELQAMKMITNNGIFYEFVPFNEKNFDKDGNMVENPEVLTLRDVEENKEYALLLSTCAGAWRYLIGDVIKFTNKRNAEILITGRTKHFLSLCGEHLSVDNMTKAIEMVAQELNIEINEFTVAGIKYQNLFAHHWYVGTNKQVDSSLIREKLDNYLKQLNDDYRVERIAALKEVIVDILPDDIFIQFLEYKKRAGAQSKFPRVIKGALYDEWKQFLIQKGYDIIKE